MPTVQSVHVPGVMDSISVVGRKSQVRKCLSINDIHSYANDKGISFISAYRILASSMLVDKEK